VGSRSPKALARVFKQEEKRMLRRVGLITAICILGLLLTACERQKISDITTDPGGLTAKT
jgi:hypothetical protein